MKQFLLYLFVICICISCNQNHSHLYRINIDDKYGYIDSLGNEIIKPQYLFASSFKDGLALIVVDTISVLSFDSTSNKLINNFTFQYGYINTSNKIVINTSLKYHKDYDSLIDIRKYGDMLVQDLLFSEGLAMFQTGENIGYMNKKGEEIIAAHYVDGLPFSGGLAAININNNNPLWGYVDHLGRTIIEPRYQYASLFSEGLALVLRNNISEISASAESMEVDESIIANLDFSWLIINKKGNIIIGPINGLQYRPLDFSDGYARFLDHSSGGWGFLDKQGNQVGDFYEKTTYYSDGFAAVKFSSIPTWIFVGKIDANGQAMFRKTDYEEIAPFSERYAAVKRNAKWGYVDTTLNEVIPCKYDTAGPFLDGLAPVILKNNSLIIDGYINQKGEMVWHNEKYEGFVRE